MRGASTHAARRHAHPADRLHRAGARAERAPAARERDRPLVSELLRARPRRGSGRAARARRRGGGRIARYNNAAIIAYGRKIADLRAEDWDRTIAVNLRGPFLCAKHALPHLVRRGGGVIINVSSHGAFQASPTGIADYAVAKGGLVTLTYYLASEYGADNVRANCIAPGPVPTDLNRPFLGTPEGRAMTAALIPLGRVGEIDDVVRAAVFLASDEARWITGAVLRVDGGIVVQ
ncbi:MAG: SDR family oxidoreductase [Deltaproteobacteria bacterium]|nr:MAG: SDR family oxidoreductase [Deltaproteobacteria bacterium]